MRAPAASPSGASRTTHCMAHSAVKHLIIGKKEASTIDRRHAAANCDGARLNPIVTTNHINEVN